MIQFQDASFSHSYTEGVNMEVGQQIYVGVFVQGVDSHQIAIVIDSCWATSVIEKKPTVCWDLITRK